MQLNNNKKIYILCDIDFDGFASSVIIYKYLKYINPNIDVQPLFHKSRIHGLKEKYIMDKLLDEKPSLLICPDSASGDFKQHKILKENGVNLLILDHHPVSDESKYAVVINNHLSKDVVNKSPSGAMVTHKFLLYLDKCLGYNYAPYLSDIVYFSLLSDVCDMSTYENRFYANNFSNIIMNKLLKCMIDSLSNGEHTNTDYSWNVVPKISAIIRGEDDGLKETLWWALATEEQSLIDIILKECKKAHNHQKNTVKKYVSENIQDVDNSHKVIFEESGDIQGEYRGLVASKYVGEFNKPTILYHLNDDGDYIASVRSNIDIKTMLKDSGLFSFCEGHLVAFGCGWKQSNHNDILNYLYAIDTLPEPSEAVLASYTSSNIPHNLFGLFEPYEDLWGQGISRPKFHITNIHINSSLIKEIRYDAQILFYCNGIAYKKKYVSRDVKNTTWHMNDNVDLSIECIGELLIDDYNNKPYVLMDKVEINIDKNEYDLDEIFKEC